MTASRAAGNARPSLLVIKRLHVDKHLRLGQCIEPRFEQQSSFSSHAAPARHLGQLSPNQCDLTGCTRHRHMHAHLYNKAVWKPKKPLHRHPASLHTQWYNVSTQRPTLADCAPYSQPAEPKQCIPAPCTAKPSLSNGRRTCGTLKVIPLLCRR
jgi:hypothetical protein